MAEFGEFMTMVRQSTTGSVLIIQHEGSERFLQFVQRSESLETSRLLFGFPDAPWSRRSFAAVVSALAQAGFECQITETDNPITLRFAELIVEEPCDAGSLIAAKVARVAATAMGLDETARFTIHLEGGTDIDRWAWENQAGLERQLAAGGFPGRLAAKRLAAVNRRLAQEAVPQTQADAAR